MAYLSRVTYPAVDAEGETLFAVPFQYLNKAHVKVYTRAVGQEDFETDPLVEGDDYDWSGDAQIELDVAAASEDILIKRETPRTEVISTHQPGAFSSDNANLIDTAFLFIAQEVEDEAVAQVESNFKRTIRGRHGEVITWMEPAATRAGKFMSWDATGLIPSSVNVDAAAIGALSGVIDEMVALSFIVDDILALSAITGAVVTVAANVGSVNTVAANIGSAVTVAGSIANVNTVAGLAGNINILAPISANIVTVAANSANINTVAADINLGVAGLMYNAGAALTAALTVLATSYTYKHSVNDRRSLAVITDFGTGALAGTANSYAIWQQLIDGVIGGATPNVQYFAGGAVAGRLLAYVPKKDEFPWFRTDELRLRFGTSINNGTWEPVGFRGITYDIDGVPTGYSEIVSLGAGVLITGTNLSIPFTNNEQYEAYGLRGVSGTAAASGVGTGFHEMELKGRTSESYGRHVLPKGATPGQVVRADAAGRAAWRDPQEPEGRALFNHLWLFNEGHGRYVRDQVGGIDFDLGTGANIANKIDIGGGGSWAWKGGELELINTAISTGTSITAQAVWLIYESVEDQGHYAIGIGNNNNLMHTSLRFTSTSPKLKLIHGLGIKNPVYSGNGTQAGFANGGTSGAMASETSAVAGPIIINANRNTDWAGRIASPIRILGVATSLTDPTQAQAQQAQTFLDWQTKRNFGRVLTGEFADRKCAVALWTGESTHHTSLVMDLEPGLTEAMRKKFYNTNLIAAMGPSAGGSFRGRLQKLSYWMDRLGLGYQLGNESLAGVGTAQDDRNRKMGPLYGFAEKELYADTPFEHPIFHFKMAQGSTLLAPFGSALAAGGTLTLTTTFDAGATTGATLFLSLQAPAWGKFEAEVRRLGFGIEYITRYDARGLNDSTELAASVIGGSGVNFQTWLGVEHARMKTVIGVSYLKTYSLIPHLPIPGAAENYANQCGQPGVTSYANDAAGHVQFDNLLYIRTGNRDHCTASSGEVVAVEADGYGTNILNGDSVHMGLGSTTPSKGMIGYGGDSRRRFYYTAKVTKTFDVT